MDLQDAAQLKAMIVDPVIASIQAEIGPLVSRVKALEDQQEALAPRVEKLESYAGRLVKVYSGLVAVLTFAVHYGWQKIRDKFHLS